ncbi:sensor histidine kinase [Paenibacillus sp. WLX2291]|uniref:cache domain-containing sensor histidine kinase n=1 Tax=Paenibacillus sp. WLX2291 TaxID=3296934 RepID=UPI0039841E17
MSADSGFAWLRQSSLILRRLSIKHRLLAAFLITSILPVGIVALYSNQIYEASTTAKISATSTQTLDQLSRNISRELEQYETLSENIIINSTIQDGLSRYDRLTDYDKNQLQTRIRNQLGQQIFSLSNLSSVVILTNGGSSFFDLGYQWYPGDQLATAMSRTTGSPYNAYWSYLRSNRGTPVLALTRKIYSEDNLNVQLGYLVISFDEKVFARNMYQSVSLGEGSSLYMTNSAGQVVSSSMDNIAPGDTFHPEIAQQVVTDRRQHNATPFEAKLDGQQALVTSSYIQSADWYLVGLIPRSFIVSELYGLRLNVIWFCLLTLLAAGLVAMWIYVSISSPMRSLLIFAKRVDRGRLDTPIVHYAHPDEMQRLTLTIYSMVGRLQTLIRQVQTEQHAKREMELKMLQAQINPHFLFNTLNSLKWSAMLSGNSSLTEGIGSLSELLRNTILMREEYIPLSREADNVQHYGNIQRIRYGDSFELHIHLQPGTQQCLVPKFILQPIVENSILHGGDGNGRLHITVNASMEHDELVIVIADDGRGFDPVSVAAAQEADERLSGIGIGNVHERIVLHYGEAYGLRTDSKLNQGTRTVIRLPIQSKEETQYV